jgi:hypothetical protein
MPKSQTLRNLCLNVSIEHNIQPFGSIRWLLFRVKDAFGKTEKRLIEENAFGF